MNTPKSEGMDITTNAALHGLPLTNQPGTNTVRDGNLSWQNSPPGSMRPFVRGWPSARGASRRWHSTHGSSVRSRESTWPLQRATSLGSMSGGTRPRVVGGFLQHEPASVEGVCHCSGTQLSAKGDERHATGGGDGSPAAVVHLCGLRGNFGSALEPTKLGPCFVPIAAQIPTAQALLGKFFDLRRQRRVHVPAPGKALVQVLLVHPGNAGEFGSFFWADFRHDAHDSVSLVGVKRFAFVCVHAFGGMRE